MSDSLRRYSLLLMLAFVWMELLPSYGHAQEGADEDEPFLPGLIANYRHAQGHTATRLDYQLAFSWGELPPDPRLTAGEFRVSWQGNLLTTSHGNYRFFVFGCGEVELKIAGRVAITRQTIRNGWASSSDVALTADYHTIEFAFRRTEKDAHLMLLWSGPDFGREPIPARFLYHPRHKPVERDFERGRLLARVLRCGRCHGEDLPSAPAPALDRLSGNLSRDWLVRWLTDNEHGRDERSPRRMPGLGVSANQAAVLADWLLLPREPKEGGERSDLRSQRAGSVSDGERLFVSLGCLACHSWRDLGASGWHGGGDLTHIADKRPPGFFDVWLAEPDRLNRDHRMPVFQLSNKERASLALFLSKQKASSEPPVLTDWSNPHQPAHAGRSPSVAEGRKLAEQFGCASCHRLPETIRERTIRSVSRLDGRSNWENSCAGLPDAKKHRPGYRLSKDDARALSSYYAAVRSNARDGMFLLAEHNCLACHARDGTREAIPLLPPLLADKLIAVSKRYPDLAPQVPAMTPPALNSVGDKLTDSALAESIARRSEPHRPYLRVRMPHFPLGDADLQALVHHLIDSDRVPPRPLTLSSPPGGEGGGEGADSARRNRYTLAGGRLVSSDGFGCTSCHAVGRVQPANDSISARGPDLSQLERRIRKPWFDRWVRNPARIVPRMEMPSVQIPVAGVLDGKLDDQLDAAWHVLNSPGFEPPLPNPIRTLRHSGNQRNAEPIVLTDILEHGKRIRIKPFLVGLANRHNVLFDLETGALALWSAGDVARQHTRGKAWFWEPAGAVVLDTGMTQPDLSLNIDGRDLAARPLRQFFTEADAWQTEESSVCVSYRLKIEGGTLLHIRRRWTPSPAGFSQELSLEGVPTGAKVRLHLLSAERAAKASRTADGSIIQLGDRFVSRIVLAESGDRKFAENAQSLLLYPDEKGTLRVVLHYESAIPLDRFSDVLQPPDVASRGEPVEVAPGFTGIRLPLPPHIMPTGLGWRPDGRLVFCSLKGQVFEGIDTNGDGVEDRLNLLADGLPAPYGIHADADHIDISAKYALLRLRTDTKSGRRIETVASGWGYSTDYHDWVVGLPQNERGEYFLGIPCQQDKRSPADALFHGNILGLTPRKPTPNDPRLFTLTPLSAGHRFPMGLALDRAGELFVTDNQGNYKPFNELNHVLPGTHFGFINFLDRGKSPPRRTPSAIDIPHPWTRSVNGICFLYTPKELRSKLGHDLFGPLEGHLIGCEYDTRRLIRMTLQRVGDAFQGAAYPLSIPPSDPQRGFLGPLVCAVSPRGELYVGSIRDSGWGAGANVGEIVRVQVQPDKLPCGIAEVRATPDGFRIDFFRPIDRELAARTESYTIQSYRREPTPAYGSPDRDRRSEKVTSLDISSDARTVTLKLAEMRPGFMYELRLKNLAPVGGDFHPAEAHYTLVAVPK